MGDMAEEEAGEGHLWGLVVDVALFHRWWNLRYHRRYDLKQRLAVVTKHDPLLS